jgi:hypothetical protein
LGEFATLGRFGIKIRALRKNEKVSNSCCLGFSNVPLYKLVLSIPVQWDMFYKYQHGQYYEYEAIVTDNMLSFARIMASLPLYQCHNLDPQAFPRMEQRTKYDNIVYLQGPRYHVNSPGCGISSYPGFAL